MPHPDESSQPRLTAGCRWAQSSSPDRMLLFPEGALRLKGTGREILECCDGQRTVGQIVEELQARYHASEPSQIKQEVIAFLEQLQRKRIVNF
jgi:pyrroloquinoline quinone biosynthesis protein D